MTDEKDKEKATNTDDEALDQKNDTKSDEKSTPKHAAEKKKVSFKNPKVITLVIVIVVCLIAAVAGATYLAYSNMKAAEEEAARAEIETPPAPEPEEELVENPIDFAEWQARNPDIYSWITYPNTAINHPILQNAEDMDYYLKLNMDGEYSEYGELYTQRLNTKDYEDPVTVIYGHTFPDTDVMFSDLHYLEDPAFMEANPYVYIYTPDKILTYEVIAVEETDNTLILSKDLSTPEAQQEYFDSIINPSWEWAIVKSGATLTGGEDKIIQLSTCCIPSDASKRFIVTAKLVDKQGTY